MTAQIKIAKLLRANLPGFCGNAALYRCTPPLPGWDDDKHELVIASGVDNAFAHECYLFPGGKDGKVSDWGELPGSIKGTTDHAQAFADAGYEVQR